MYFCYFKFEGAQLLFLLKLRYCLKTFQIKYTIYKQGVLVYDYVRVYWRIAFKFCIIATTIQQRLR